MQNGKREIEIVDTEEAIAEMDEALAEWPEDHYEDDDRGPGTLDLDGPAMRHARHLFDAEGPEEYEPNPYDGTDDDGGYAYDE